MLPEYESKYYNRFYGKRRARVEDNLDPKRLGRIRVHCPALYGDGISDWADPCMPFYGGRDCGFFSVPPVGSMVWVECEEGLIDYLIYTGGFYAEVDDGHGSDGSDAEEDVEFQNDRSSVPAHAKGFYDGSDTGGPKGNKKVPATSFEGQYGEVTVLRTKSGHMLELDDTKGAERVQLHHKSGSHVEILPDGTIHIISTGRILSHAESIREFSSTDKLVEVGTDCTETVGGNHTKNINGELSNNILGGTTHNTSSVTSKVDNGVDLDVGSLTGNINATLDLTVGSRVSLNTFSNVDIVSNGKGFMSFNNTTGIPALPYIDSSLNLVASNGTARLVSGDPTQELSVYGIEARGGSPGGQVYLGALNTIGRTPTLAVGPVPLLKENAVCGLQLLTFLQTMTTILNTFLGASTAVASIPPAAATAATALTAAQLTFLTTPAPTQPLILSESVYLSKV